MERKHVPTFCVPQHLQQYAVQPGKMALSSDHIKHTKSNCKGLVLSVCVLGEQGKICPLQVTQLPGLEQELREITSCVSLCRHVFCLEELQGHQ